MLKGFRNLMELPDNLVLEILSYLKKKDLIQLSRVSKRWRRLCFDRYLWKEISTNEFSSIHIVDDVVRNLLQFGKSLNKLSLRGCYQISNKVLKIAALNGSNINHLDLENCFKITDRGIMTLAKSCAKLKTVNLLNTLITESGICCLIRENPKLLELSANPLQMNEKTIHLLTETCKSIEYLHVEQNEFTPTIKSQNKDVALTSTMMEMIAYNCPRLQVLILRYPLTSVSDRSVTIIGQYCKRLECMEIGDRRHDQKLSDVGVINLCANSMNLLRLDLTQTYTTDITLLAISKYCPLIEQLSIESDGPVTDIGVFSIVKNCHNLDSLNIQGGIYSRLTDHSVFTIAQSACSYNLLKLSMKGWNITDFGLNILAKNVPNLMYLSIEGCSYLSNNGLKESLKYFTNIQSLNISRTKCVTYDKELLLLAQLFHEDFKSLILQSDANGENNITESGCEEFNRIMPECEIIFVH